MKCATMRRLHTAATVLSAAVLTASLAAGALAQAPSVPRESVVMRAARDELARTMAQLNIEKAERPYFVAYTVTESEWSSVAASVGSLLSSSRGRTRMLRVEVRVGDYAFDNTNFARSPGAGAPGSLTYFGMAELPLDDDYMQLRRQIWLATDGAYKAAVEGIAGKRAALLNRTRTDSLPDFTREDVTQTTDELPSVAFDVATGEALVRALSQGGASPGIYTSSVSMSANYSRTFYINSEGTTYVRTRPIVTLSASASTQAADGMPLSTSWREYARSMDALPNPAQAKAKVGEMLATLDTVRGAPQLDRYNGPVLFEGRAAAELFSEQFAPALSARRKTVSGNAQNEMFAALMSGPTSRVGSLSEKLGARVLPDFISVVDDPTRAESKGVPLLGGYVVDDQGVRARPTRLVESGILKTFLAGRTPVEGAPRSTGNYRGSGAVPSNMVVEVTGGLDDAALRERLLALAKTRGLPFAIIIRDLGASGSPTDPATMMAEMMGAGRSAADRGRIVFRAYKLFADGHEEPVRGAQLMGLGLDMFKGIVAASAGTSVLLGISLSAFVVPSLLFDDLTLVKRTDELPKPPFSVPPEGTR